MKAIKITIQTKTTKIKILVSVTHSHRMHFLMNLNGDSELNQPNSPECFSWWEK